MNMWLKRKRINLEEYIFFTNSQLNESQEQVCYILLDFEDYFYQIRIFSFLNLTINIPEQTLERELLERMFLCVLHINFIMITFYVFFTVKISDLNLLNSLREFENKQINLVFCEWNEEAVCKAMLIFMNYFILDPTTLLIFHINYFSSSLEIQMSYLFLKFKTVPFFKEHFVINILEILFCRASELDRRNPVRQNKEMGCAQHQTLPRAKKLLTLDCRRRSSIISNDILENVHIIPNSTPCSQFLYQSLKRNPLFRSLEQNEVTEMAKGVLCARGKKDTYIFKEGDVGSCFFIVQSGSVTIQKLNFTKQLSVGDCFGELALIYKSQRTASIRCVSDCTLLVIRPMLFKATLRKIKLKEYEQNLSTIEAVPYFQSLTNKQKFYISNIVKTLRFNPQQTIFELNEKAYSLYILREGRIKIQLENNKEIIIEQYETFGESAIKEDNIRKGRAVALTNVVCCMISKAQIEQGLGLNVNSLIDFHTKRWALLKSPCFKHLTPLQIDTMNVAFKTCTIANDTVPQEKSIIICLEGRLNNGSTEAIFNDKEWAQNAVPVRVSGSGRYAYLFWSDLDCIFITPPSTGSLTNIDLRNFCFVRTLGSGSYGEVSVIRNKHLLNTLHAVKCLSKSKLVEEDMVRAVVEEKNILEKIIFPYIVGFVKALHDKDHIYLLMEYIEGKELFTIMRESDHMDRRAVRYYFACALLSLQYLHSNSIIYRDLKPQNIVVSTGGKPFLIDLGAAKLLSRGHCFKTFTIVGTPHYMAPQVFSGEGYSFEADIWSLGCILYEMIYGRLPFGQELQDADPYTVYKEVCNGKVSFGSKVKDNRAEHLILSMLRKNPHERRLTGSIELIKKNMYFSDFEWRRLKEEKMEPPFKPCVESVENNVGEVPYLKQKYGNEVELNIMEWDERFDLES